MITETPPRHDNSIVRYHRADGTLTVTRDDETDEHIIKSRGRKSRDTWTRRVPAFRVIVAPGEHLWRIPGNWATYYRLKSTDGPDKSVHHIPESGQSLLLSLADQHAPIADAYHTVEAVGRITWTARAEVDQIALRDTLNSVYHSDWSDDGITEVLQYVRDNPRDAVKDAETEASGLAGEYVENWRWIPASEFDPFQESFLSSHKMVSHPDYEPENYVMRGVHELLKEYSVVPPSPLVSVTVR